MPARLQVQSERERIIKQLQEMAMNTKHDSEAFLS
jgi:hypothetical protein